jgi:hypothetical protein
MVTARPMRPFLNGFFSKYSKAKFGAPSGDPEQVSLADLTFATPCRGVSLCGLSFDGRPSRRSCALSSGGRPSRRSCGRPSLGCGDRPSHSFCGHGHESFHRQNAQWPMSEVKSKAVASRREA